MKKPSNLWDLKIIQKMNIQANNKTIFRLLVVLTVLFVVYVAHEQGLTEKVKNKLSSKKAGAMKAGEKSNTPEKS